MLLTPTSTAMYSIKEECSTDGVPGLYTGYSYSSQAPADGGSVQPREGIDPDRKGAAIFATDLPIDPQASTSQLRPKRNRHQVDRFGKSASWESVGDLEDRTSGPLTLALTESLEDIKDLSRKVDTILSPPQTSADIPMRDLITSYDSLFNIDDSLSEPDGEYADDDGHSPSQSPKLLEIPEGRRKITKRKSAPKFLDKRISLHSLAKNNVTFKTCGDQEYIVQWKWCHSITNVTLQNCRHCISKMAGDSCRFLRFRGLPIKRDGEDIEFLQPPEYFPILLDDPGTAEAALLPEHFDLNRPMDKAACDDIMAVAATSLIDIFREGLQHATLSKCVQRSRELQIRAMCDYCSTGLFVASYMCQRCGHEYCLQCKKILEGESGDEAAAKQIGFCVKDVFADGKAKKEHSVEMMTPISRFSKRELETVIRDMEKTIDAAKKGPSLLGSTKDHLPTDGNDSIEVQANGVLDDGAAAKVKTELIENDLMEESTPLVLSMHPLATYSKDTMTEDDFLATWSKGEPLLVTNVATRKEWDPLAFITLYGDMDCEIVRSDEQPKVMSAAQRTAKKKEDPNYFKTWSKIVNVREFFETFGRSMEERGDIFGEGIWKLKDWPPAAEFSTFFPDIYKDFNYAVPMPDYTRRDGCRNISSLFPKNANGPDLGPKMYNAWPGEHSEGKKGTTCLHMDIADAVNIMLYTSDSGEAPAAQWDIFRAQDAGAIREFLIERYPTTPNHGDPIHAQIHFLDDEALKDLYQQKQVYSWRILQRKGQAVFIPAGCAHQVCNLADCIKVAVDFISPQNISRCFKLTEEFRGMTVEGRKSWKEDVLQLRAQLWYAWLACQAMPKEPTVKDHQREKERREARLLKNATEEAQRQAQRGAKRLLTNLKQEVYIPRLTASGRGAKKSQEVEVKQEVEEIGSLSIDASSSNPKRKGAVLPHPSADAAKGESVKKVKKEVVDRGSVDISSDEEAELRSILRLSSDPGRKIANNVGRPMRKGKKPCVGCNDTHSTEWRLGPTGPKTLCLSCGTRWASRMRSQGKDPKVLALRGEAKQQRKRERRLADHISSTDDDLMGTEDLREDASEVQRLVEGEAIDMIEASAIGEAVSTVLRVDASTETDETPKEIQKIAKEDKATNTLPLLEKQADEDEDPMDRIAEQVNKLIRPLTEKQSIQAGQIFARLGLLPSIDQAAEGEIETPPPRDENTFSMASLLT